MIIFDLDGTLANIDHRRHHIDPTKRDDVYYHELSDLKQMKGWYYLDDVSYPKSRVKFKPDWKKFFDDCHLDRPNDAVMKIFVHLAMKKNDIEIWTGRPEKLRAVTEEWLDQFLHVFMDKVRVKMRPDNDNTPDFELKEIWLRQEVEEGKEIEMVFEDRNRVVQMYRKLGIPCFQVDNGDY
jgi:phosphoglycolate phosphatase-like HAD superfamily hydrolase